MSELTPPDETAAIPAPLAAEAVALAWGRIAAWAGRAAPALQASLRPGASEESLAAFEAKYGLTLSPGLRASLAVYDGQTVKAGGANPGVLWAGDTFRLLPLSTLTAVAEEWAEAAAMGFKATTGLWMPFAQASSGDTLSVDILTDRVSLSFLDDEEGALVYPYAHLGQLLGWIADELEAGKIAWTMGALERKGAGYRAVRAAAEDLLDDTLDVGGGLTTLLGAVSAAVGDPVWLLHKRWGHRLEELVEWSGDEE